MLHKINLENILFLDIETVPEFSSYEEMDEQKQLLAGSSSIFHFLENYEKHIYYENCISHFS